MKNKGIPFIEQHVEKIVLGVAGAVFFSVLAWQVLGTPNHVKLDGKDVAPGEIDAALASRANALKSKLSETQKPLESQLGDKVKPIAADFSKALSSSVSPAGDLPRIEPLLASVLQSDGATGGQLFHEPAFAAVAMRPVIQVSDTFEETVIKQHESIAARFKGTSGPYDVTWTVPSAMLDVKELRSELKSTSKGAQIPELWYRSTLFVIDVAFERERRGSDGAWSDRTVVEPLPGAFSFRPEIAKGADASLRDGAFTYLADPIAQRQIIQPDFLATVKENFTAGTMLVSDEAGAQAEDPEVRSLRRAVAKQALLVSRLEEDLKAKGGPLEDTKDDKKKDDKKDEERSGRSGGQSGGGASRPGGGLGGGGGLAGGMDGGKRTGGADPNDEATRKERIAMTKRLADLRKKLAQFEKQLSDRLAATGTKVDPEQAKKQDLSNLAASDRVLVWAHDIGVSSGESYRYRCVVKTYNPFFTNANLLVSEQKSLGEPFTLDTKVSDWGDPIRVSPPVSFFVVDAAAGEGRLGVGQATIEVFRYYNGERRRERFVVQPGEAIGTGGAKGGEVDFDTGFYLVDVFADAATDRGGTDRRPAAVAVVQSIAGDRYEIRIPKDDAGSSQRAEFEDEIAMAKAAKGSAPDAPADGAAGAAGAGGSAPQKPGGGLSGN